MQHLSAVCPRHTRTHTHSLTHTHEYTHSHRVSSALWQLKRGVWRQLRKNAKDTALNPLTKLVRQTAPLYHCTPPSPHRLSPRSTTSNAIASSTDTRISLRYTNYPSISILISNSIAIAIAIWVSISTCDLWSAIDLRDTLPHAAPVRPAANANFLIVINNSPLGIVKQLKQTRHRHADWDCRQISKKIQAGQREGDSETYHFWH